MKTREVKFEPVDPQGPAQKKKGSWLSLLTRVGAVLVVLALVGASAVVFAQLSAHRQSQGPSKNPLAGKWVPVLKGFTLTSLVVADSTPSMLYACATHAQPYTPLPSLPPNRVGTGEPVFTVLRSTDSGAHWQDVGGKANLGYSCQVAVNPTNGNELFAASIASNNGQTVGFLKHSLDSGATWTTIQPLLNWPSAQPIQVWNVRQLSMVNGRLFGLQWITQRPLPVTNKGPLPRYFPQIARLVMSIDYGHTWRVLDSQIITTNLEARSYAVDPTNTSTIYELVGRPWLPVQPGIVEPNDVLPLVGYSGDLYKTTDNGANWHLVLKGLPFGAQVHVQVVRGNGQMIYAGGSPTPVPYTLKAPGANRYGAYGFFQLELSRDGGASWHAVPSPLGQAYIQNWFAGANGEVYAYTFNLQGTPPGGQVTAVAGTAVAVTPVPAATRTVPKGMLAPDGSLSAAPASALLQTGTPGSPLSIERYDPGTDAWSAVTSPPVNGALLALTPGSSGGDVLWFMGEDKGQKVLYRFVV